MNMARQILNPPVITTIVIVLFVSFTTIYRSTQSAQKLVGFDMAARWHDVVVSIDFEPESFHIAILQSKGRLVGIEKSNAFLRKVSSDNLAYLSRKPWITSIKVFSEDGGK